MVVPSIFEYEFSKNIDSIIYIYFFFVIMISTLKNIDIYLQ